MNIRKGWAPYWVLLSPADAGAGGGTDTQTPEQIAAAATAAAEQVAATAAAAAAAAGKTPEQLAADAAQAETARQAAELATVPEKYELTLPDGSPLNDEDVKDLAAEAKALGLTNGQAAQLVQLRADAVKAYADRSAQELGDIKTDPVLGGAHYEQTLKQTAAAMSWMFVGDEKGARDFFDSMGLANNKTLIRGLAKLGKAIAEDTPVGAATSTRTAERVPTEDVLFPSSAKKSA